MSDPLTDAANAISTSSPNIRAFAQLAAQRIIALEAGSLPPQPVGYDAATNWPRPPFIPSRTITVTTPTQLQTALNVQGGDLIRASGFTYTGELVITAQPASLVEIHFDNVLFRNTARDFPAVWLNGAKNLRLYGGDFSSSGGTGLLCYDPVDVTWYDIRSHDCGADGIGFHGIQRPITGCDFKGEIWNCGLDTTCDPHAEKGTGLHGVYLGGSAYPITGSRFAFHVHDQPSGAAVQVNKCDGCTFYVKSERLTKAAQSQVAGNAIQWWGVNGQLAASNCRVPWLEGTDLQGRMSETGGVEPSAIFTGNTVLHGRGQRVMLNPLVTGSAYRSHPGIVYTDCQP